MANVQGASVPAQYTAQQIKRSGKSCAAPFRIRDVNPCVDTADSAVDKTRYINSGQITRALRAHCLRRKAPFQNRIRFYSRRKHFCRDCFPIHQKSIYTGLSVFSSDRLFIRLCPLRRLRNNLRRIAFSAPGKALHHDFSLSEERAPLFPKAFSGVISRALTQP